MLKAPRDGYRRRRDVFILSGDGRGTVPVFRRQVTVMVRARREQSCARDEGGMTRDTSKRVHSVVSTWDQGP